MSAGYFNRRITMKKMLPVIVAVLFVNSPLIALQHSFDSQKTTFNQLPQEAQQTIEARAGNTPVHNIQMETFDGFTTYLATFNKNGKPQELRVDSKGQVWGSHWREIPPAVEKVADQRIGDGQLLGFRKQNVNGQAIYHFRYDQSGVPTDLWLTANGKPIAAPANAEMIEAAGTPSAPAQENITTQLNRGVKVDFNTLPEAAKNTVLREAKGAPVEDVDKGTINGQTAYEVAFKRDGKTYELQVREDGSIVGGHFD